MEKLFRLQENNTTVKTEIGAGVTTFMTMAYILAVNPNILGASGMDTTAVLIATALASCIGTFCMAFLANMPFALSAGMGLNAYFAYTVVLGQGVSWQTALMAVFIEGIIFILLTLTNVREAIFNAIPINMKTAVSVGIGIFIAFIGLQNAGLAVDSETLVTITNFTENFHTAGIQALLAMIGLFVIAILYIKNIRGSSLIGIIVTWLLGIFCQLTGIYQVDVENGFYSLLPAGIISFDFSALGQTFGQCFHADFSTVSVFNFIVIVFSFMFVDIFDTIGTLIGVSSKADMLDENGHLPAIKPSLLSDAIGTSAGAILGTSTTTTFVESASGVAAGGRTGLTSLTTGCLFLLSIIFAPLFTSIPSFATAPALLMVGFLMFEGITKLNFNKIDITDAIPCYLCIIAMPLFYSISEGISIGCISYVIIKLACGKSKEITPLMYVLAVLFILKYIFL
ncbi:MAG: NCS2 family permease [Firmicutes bacterium]|nr:NCS2 family permease [Bacillota bacterium]